MRKNLHPKILKSSDESPRGIAQAMRPRGGCVRFYTAYKVKFKSSIEEPDLGRCVVPRQRNGKILQFSQSNPLSFCVLTFSL